MEQPRASNTTDEAVPVNKEGISMGQEGISMGQEGNLLTEALKKQDDVEILVHLLTSAASLVQGADGTQKAAQLALHCTEDALHQASEATELARTVFHASRQLGERMLLWGYHSSYQEMFQKHPELSPGFETFQRMMQEAEDVLSHHNRNWNMTRLGVDPQSPARRYGHREEDGLHSNGHILHEKNSSHHKQLQTLRNEEHMGGTYMTHRRRSPRHSPTANTDGLSPLLSEEELFSIKPITHSPSRQSSARFTNKIVHWDKSHERSDTEPENSTGSPS